MDVACGASVPEGHDEPKPSFSGPTQVLDDAETHTASITTSCGEISIELWTGQAPVTANNFAFLASEGFYDATVIHRVVPGFVVQMGDPRGDGTGDAGYRFGDELDAARQHGYSRGTVAMANSGPDSNGSQFFICLADIGLPPQYAVFGTVVDGMDAVDRIAAVPTSAGDVPRQTVFLESARLT